MCGDNGRFYKLTQFLNMCTCTSSTAEALYNVLDGKHTELLRSPNPWNMCTTVGVGYTSVNIGIRDSIKTRVLLRNLAIYFSGRPCHIIHNAARKACDVFYSCCGFDKCALIHTTGLINVLRRKMA